MGKIHDDYDFGAVEIETSTDDVEDVKDQLGGEVEIDESTEESTEEPEKTEKPKAPKVGKEAKPKAETEEEEKPESEEEETTEEEPEKESEEKPDDKTKGKEKPKVDDKDVKESVPRARLNAEIKRRKDAERRLERLEAQEDEPEREVEIDKPEEPEFFSGIAKPKLADFMKGVDKFDAEAVAEATGKFTETFTEWAGKEAEAKADYRAQQRELKRQQDERNAVYQESQDRSREIHEDYDQVVKGSKVFVSGVMEAFMYESELGGEISYFFAENPKEAKKIVAIKSQRGQNEAMFALEATLREQTASDDETEKGEDETETAPKKVIPPKKPITRPSKAPPPTTPVKGGGGGPRSLQELAGPEEKVGVDLEFNPEYEKAYKAGRRT